MLHHNSAFSYPQSPHNTAVLQSSSMLCLILAFELNTALRGHKLPCRQKARARHDKSLSTPLSFCCGKIPTNGRHRKKKTTALLGPSTASPRAHFRHALPLSSSPSLKVLANISAWTDFVHVSTCRRAGALFNEDATKGSAGFASTRHTRNGGCRSLLARAHLHRWRDKR